MEYSSEVIERLSKYCGDMPGAYEARPFGNYPICYKVMGKIFAQLNPQEDFYKMTLKCDRNQAEVYRQLYPGVVVRGYHCPAAQQPYWNTIDLHQFEGENLLCGMIEEAYQEVKKKLTRKDRARLERQCGYIFKMTDGADPDFAMLCGKLDQELEEIVGCAAQRSQYEQYNKRDHIHDVLLVYQDDQPVACGGFKFYDKEHAELKRIYAEPSVRGSGLGAEIVRRLEVRAKIQGYTGCILETGKMLEAAMHTYGKLGYKVIPNYGQYAQMEASTCMQRRI